MKNRIIISGGGTGGHVFPAIAIADAIRQLDKDTDILFVGALGKIEMEKVPAAGYKIIGLPIQGFKRKLSWKNMITIIKLIYSLIKARKIIRDFKPSLAIGVGGYASGPVLRIAEKMGIPVLIQEQNSYAGVTNRLLASKAAKICVAYHGMEKYFPEDKIILTGNPIRANIKAFNVARDAGISHFGLNPQLPVVLSLGGSLGAGTINNSISRNLQQLKNENIQLIWQTGKNYFDDIIKQVGDVRDRGIYITRFITEMEMAFAAADIIISRAGAGTISELCVVGKPVILVPSPNVSEDHQTKNARSLSDKGAALLVPDNDAMEQLINTVLDLIKDPEQQQTLGKRIKLLARPDSDLLIAREALKLIEK